MFNSNTDREWEKFGKDDPYYGVFTHDNYRKSNITDEKKEEFFATGVNYVDDVLKKIRWHIDENFTIKKALDFGCGVGRLVIPLANIAQEVTGIDVSDSMLNEAKKNCSTREIKNVVFKGKINVDIKEDSDYIYVEIKDNGIGFDKVNKAKMLTPYYTTKIKGTGLGLSIVTKIIYDHNSTILFNSIKDGAQVEIAIPKIKSARLTCENTPT